MKRVAFLLTVVMALMFFYASVDLPSVGDAESAPNSHVSPRYIEKSYKETHSPNLVTAVLADYRGYDTLGETTVIFVAGIVTVMVLRLSGKKSDRGGDV